MASYDYLDQALSASILVQPFDNESFFHPKIGHTGFAYDGTRYTNGIQDPGPVFSSWYIEAPGPYRSAAKPFPTQAIVLLSKVSMVILDETNSNLPLWMQFLLEDNFALPDNFENAFIGFTTQLLTYSNGVISVTSVPDPGSQIQSNMIVTFDFVADQTYLYVALTP